jgi:hypothetical protein
MNRLALLIAINEYPNLAPSHQLKGCVTDSALVHELLTSRFNFQDGDITTLANGEATREGILEAMDRLAGTRNFAGQSLLQQGDLVVIAYSGHGSRTKDVDGDETDGYDSTLVPTDSDRPVPVGKGGANRDITDDVLFAYFETIRQKIGKDGHLILWFDCCHSGTIARDIEDHPARELPADERPAEGGELPQERGISGWRRLSDGYVLLAGCADDEKSKEMRHPVTNEYCGAMTYELTREIMGRSGTLTYYDVFEPARKAVTFRYPTQNPQLEGDDDRTLFGTERIDTPAFVTVSSRWDNHTLILRVGAVQGATVGSTYEIRPALLADDTVLATVTISAVGTLESRALSEVQLPPTVETGCRAIERTHALSDQRLIVAVDGVGTQLQTLRSKIENSSLLRLAKTEPAHLLAICHPPRTGKEVETSLRRGEVLFAPEVRTIEEPTWFLVGRDFGLFPSPLHPVSENDAVETTFQNLETWARYLNVQGLRPPGRDPLRPLIEAQFGGTNEQSRTALTPLPRHERTGLTLVRQGDKVRLVLTNRHPAPIFVAVLSMDAVGAITPIYPFNRRTREPVLPNVPIIINFEAGLPGQLPSPLSGGRETLKIFVTLTVVDFDILGQEGTKDVTGHPALALYAGATRGGGDVAPMEIQSEEINDSTWTTIEVDYWIERE